MDEDLIVLFVIFATPLIITGRFLFSYFAQFFHNTSVFSAYKKSPHLYVSSLLYK